MSGFSHRLVGGWMLAGVAAMLLSGVAEAAKPPPPVGAGKPRVVRARKAAVRVANRQGLLMPLPFTDNFEGNFPGPWYFYGWPQWDRTTYCAVSGQNSIYCAQSEVPAPGPYPDDSFTWITYGPFSTEGATAGQVAFQLWSQVEDLYDGVVAGWSVDDYNYEGVAWDTDTAGWQPVTVAMNDPRFANDYLGRPNVYFSIWFSSDYSTNDEGVYVDDVSIATVGGGSGQLTGRVRGPNNDPLAGVSVTLRDGRRRSVYTGADGFYRFGGLTEGTCTIIPRKPGYVFTPAERVVNLGEGAQEVANFQASLAAGDGVVRRWAVLVGISDYTGTINDLDYCDDDARDMHDALLATGWDDSRIRVLIDSDATKEAIRRAIRWMCNQADADDQVLYYHSSHGTYIPDAPPYDEPDGADEALCTYRISEDLITDDELSQWMGESRTRNYSVMLDTCFSGGHLRSANVDFASEFGGSGQIGTRDMDDLDGGVIVTACRDDQYSAELSSLKNGLFTYYVVQGLNSGRADTNQSGGISAEEIYAYVRPRVQSVYYSQTVEMWDAHPGELEFANVPTLIGASSPSRNTPGHPVHRDIIIAWRYKVQQQSAEEHFQVTDAAGRAVPGSFRWTVPNGIMRFNPRLWLRPGARYTVTVSPGVALLGGRTVWYGDEFTFRTQGLQVAPLALTASAQTTRGGQAQITVTLSAAASVGGSITNIAGREVAQLPEQALAAGTSTLSWNGQSASGLKVPPGQYLVRLQARDESGNLASFVTPLRK